MKEISYLFAHSYPSGELKHGPLALISKGFPVICLIPNNALKNKILSNVKEVESRGGNVIIFTNDKKIFNENKKLFIDVKDSNLNPILFNALQLLHITMRSQLEQILINLVILQKALRWSNLETESTYRNTPETKQ